MRRLSGLAVSAVRARIRHRFLLLAVTVLAVVTASSLSQGAEAAAMSEASRAVAARLTADDGPSVKAGLTTGPTAGDPAASKGDVTRPDRVSAATTARTAGVKVEDVSERTETTKTYANPDGTWTQSIADDAEQVQDDQGVWHPLDLSLEATPEGFAPKYGATDLTLSDGGDRQFVSLTQDGKDLGYKWPSLLPAPAISGPTATYEDVAPNEDLVVTALPSGFEYSVVLKQRPDPSAGPVQVVTPVATDGAKLVETAGDSVDFKAGGDTVVSLANPVVFDSSKDPVTGDPATANADLSVSTARAVASSASAATGQGSTGAKTSPSAAPGTATTPGAGATSAPDGATSGGAAANAPVVVVTPDAAFLADPATKYPVTIDPVADVSDSGDTWIGTGDQSGTHPYDQTLKVGTDDSGKHRYRSFMKFAGVTSAAPNSHITHADLVLRNFATKSCQGSQIEASRVTQSFTMGDITWGNQPTQVADTSTNSKAYGASGCPDNFVYFDATAAVQAWRAGAPNYGMRVNAAFSQETNNVSYRGYPSANYSSNAAAQPHMRLTYNYPPATPGAPTVSPAGSYDQNLYVGSTTPTLAVPVSDSDGNLINETFEIATTNGGTPVSGCPANGWPSGTTATCAVDPSKALTNGVTYFLRSRSWDGADYSGWSPSVKFTVMIGSPSAPSISCQDYADQSWTATIPPAGSSGPATVPCTISATAASGIATSASFAYTIGNGTEQTAALSNGATSVTVQVPATEGRHTITARAVSPVGNKSSDTGYWFGMGSHVGLETPAVGPPVVTTSRVTLSAAGHADPSSSDTPKAHVYWRLAGSGDNAKTGWTQATPDSENLTVAKAAAGGAVSVTGTWDASSVVAATAGTANAIDARVPSLLDVEICVAYKDGTDCSWEATNGSRQVLRVPHAFGDGFPVTDVAGGQVALYTGELSTAATDVTYSAGASSLSVSRTASTFDGPPASKATGVFGKGWTASLDGPGAGLADMQLLDRTRIDGTLTLLDAQGTPMVFAPAGTPTQRKNATIAAGSWLGVDDDTIESGTGATVSTDATGVVTVTFKEADGTVTLFVSTTAPNTSGDAVFAPASVTEAGDAKATRYGYDSSGRVTRIVAPAPAGTADGSCPAAGTMAAGCRALNIAYASSTTATSSSAGDVTGMISSISSQLGSATPTKEASYFYDSSGRLVGARNEHNNLTTKYGYDGDSTRVASITPPGLAPIRFEYGGDQKRLAHVYRDRPDSAGGGTATLSSIIYGVPVTGSGLPSMDRTSVSKWGQTTAPTVGAAVFGPDQPESTTDPSKVPSADWVSADLFYIDARGYEVNTASWGSGDWQPTWTSYDPLGHVVLQLDAGDIDSIRNKNAVISAAGTKTIYNTVKYAGDGTTVVLPADTVVTDTYGPARMAVLNDGTRRLVRPHTHTDFDQNVTNPQAGPPLGGINPATQQQWALPTTVTTTAADAGAKLTDLDVLSKTTTSYDDAITADTAGGQDPTPDTAGTTAEEKKSLGWSMGLAGSVIQVMGDAGANIVSRTHYDTRGRVIEQLQPKSTGSDAGTRRTSYYTADGSGTCGGKPAWDSLVCTTSYAGAGDGANGALPTTTTVYDDDQRPTTITETANGATRTTTTAYRADGQPTSSAVTATGDGSSPVASTSYSYDSATALPTGTTSSGAGAADPITTGYDTWGRATSYSAANGETTTTTYDTAGRVAKVVDPKGTTTYGYDGTDAAGNTEHRGLATSVQISNPGGRDVSLTGAYDAQGNLVMQKLPGGLTQRTTYDAADEPTGRTYSGDRTTTNADGSTTTQADQRWIGWSQDNDTLGRVRRDWTPSGGSFAGQTSGAAAGGYARQYTYDQADRLTKVIDRTAVGGAGAVAGQDDTGAPKSTTDDQTASAATACTVRDYTFDLNGNRIAKTTTPAASDGSCGPTSSATTKKSTYDAADRLTGGYVYDQFGRQTTIPQADTPAGIQTAANGGTAPGDLTIGYYATDAAKTITQNGTTTTYSLDTAGRRLAATSIKSGAATTTLTRHYTDTSDNPGWTTTATTSGSSTSTVTDRYAEGLGGDLAIDIASGGNVNNTVSVPLADLHGDTPTQASLPASGNVSGLDNWQDTDEYGNQVGPSPAVGTATTNATGHGAAYGWLGGKERAVDGSGLSLMGNRLLDIATSQFTSRDTVFNGNPTSYSYPSDPVNRFDLSGNIDIGWGLAVAGLTIAKKGLQLVSKLCGKSPNPLICFALTGAAVGGIGYVISHHHHMTTKGLVLAVAIGGLSGVVAGFARPLLQFLYNTRIGGRVVSLLDKNKYTKKVLYAIEDYITKKID